jgi:hypothetical protein
MKMTELQLDLKEMKETLERMKLCIEKIEKALKDAYFEEKILDFYADEKENG